MILCLVTDRRRLAGAAGGFEEWRRCLARQARFAAEAGVDLFQIRERDLEAAALASVVRELLAITRGTRTRLVVNDRLDVALACGADGVHLRSDSVAPAEARRIAPDRFLIGRSVHTADAARCAIAADYLIAGTMFSSVSKGPARAPIGADGLRAIASSTTVPVLAIGGIGLGNVADAARAGAAGCAAISMFIDGHADATPGCRATPLDRIVREARRAFDSAKTHP